MKKLLVSLAVLAAPATVFAEKADSVDVKKESVGIVDEKAGIFDGFYLGGGLGLNSVRYNSYRLAYKAGSHVAAGNEGLVTNYDEQKVNRPMLSFMFGYGKSFYQNVYIGVEGLIDIAQNKTKSVKVDGKEIVDVTHDSDGGYVKHKGLSAQLGIRLGYVFNKANTMIFVRPAASFFNEIELWSDAGRTRQRPDKKLSGNPKRVAFSLAVGAETKFNDNFSIRIEAERVCKRSFTADSIAAHDGTDTGWRSKANTHAYNARLLCSYYIR